MLYHFFYSFKNSFSYLNIFRYVTTRSFLAFCIATIVAIIFGRKFIDFIKKKQFGQTIREEGPKSHLKKGGTPTLGGVFLSFAAIVAIAICGNFSSVPLLATLFVFFGYFFLGLIDDWKKVVHKNTAGVSAKGKLFWQFLIAGLAMYLLVSTKTISTELYIPFLKSPICDLGYFYIFFGSLVIVSSSNAVNLTDGLDGLAVGPVITSLITLCIFCYLGGHEELSQYLYIPYTQGLSELVVFSTALIGACVGFLWYNTYPAQVFMGDVGSLSLGSVIGMLAVISKNEFLLMVFGGVFVIEALSVILQVGSFKLRKKRIFRMAPIHHHFELKGWEEPKVIVRFWIISLLLAVVALTTIKIR